MGFEYCTVLLYMALLFHGNVFFNKLKMHLAHSLLLICRVG